MPIQTISQLGTGGIIKDLPSVTLGTNIFTDGNNIRFDNNAIQTITGETVYPPSLALCALLLLGVFVSGPLLHYVLDQGLCSILEVGSSDLSQLLKAFLQILLQHFYFLNFLFKVIIFLDEFFS